MRIKLNFLSTLTLLLALGISGLSSAQSYRILLANDDGIDSPLLAALKLELEALPNTEVVVSAPRENQSGSAHSSTSGEIRVERIMRDGEFFGHGVHGKPADAVRYGIKILGDDRPFDLVVSGINRGANVGDVSHLSGTVGAAMEAVYHGLPAIAVSQEIRGVDTSASAKFTAGVVQRYREEGPQEGIVLSINIPAGELKGVKVRQMGGSYLAIGSYARGEDVEGMATYTSESVIASSDDPRTDTYAYQQGYITLTPLKFDWTAYELLSELDSWDLTPVP